VAELTPKDSAIQQVINLGDTLQVTLYSSGNPSVKFGDFKQKFILLADSSKKNLQYNTKITPGLRQKINDMINELLLLILLAQYKVMEKTYLQDKLGGQSGMHDTHLSSITRTLVEQTTNVETIIAMLENANETYDTTGFEKVKIKIQTQILDKLSDDDAYSTEKQKLVTELAQPQPSVSVPAAGEANAAAAAKAAAESKAAAEAKAAAAAAPPPGSAAAGLASDVREEGKAPLALTSEEPATQIPSVGSDANLDDAAPAAGLASDVHEVEEALATQEE
jgi:regulator of protease activity HflC (stomatin/prohibitin superfamily)